MAGKLDATEVAWGVAKISVSLDDELLAELKDAAGANVSAFIAGAVRRQLRRRELEAFLVELEDELGPVTADEMANAVAAFEHAEQTSSPSRARSRRSA
jgi:post-segregation antitoxin (ccd killing protein)